MLRFVSDTCKRLKEKKSYMVYTAVGCLGIPALSDLVKEVLFSLYFYLILLFTRIIKLKVILLIMIMMLIN